MKFKSTRDGQEEVSFQEALFKGLAPDGGLYHPVTFADLKDDFNAFNEKTDFNSIAETITHRLLGDELKEESAKSIVKRAFDFFPKVNRVSDQLSILELFHGPSSAFKDFGACFMAAAMEEFLAKENKRIIILVATSGDTGSAVARAFHGKKNIDVVILYPSGRVSLLQEKQLTTLGGNVTALEVAGAFDDCQRLVKEAFLDRTLNEKLILTSANSINLGRLFPQSFYYIYGYAQIKERITDDFIFCVPSGNFGNLTAGIYAWKWGLPVTKFLAATNVNDVVPEYLETGIFKARPSKKTLSNAMDVGNPSNFERMKVLFNGKWHLMHEMVEGEAVTDAETLETMARLYKEKNLFIDPHTAVGYLSAERFLKTHSDKSMQIMVLSTAHPAKFLETVESATSAVPEMPENLKKAMELPKESVKTGNTLNDLSDFLLQKFGA
ncbi:MAG: threonine synthase [Spirochaetales bacterium]|nr:threonine synthase [Spirochaetales bacterium]